MARRNIGDQEEIIHKRYQVRDRGRWDFILDSFDDLEAAVAFEQEQEAEDDKHGDKFDYVVYDSENDKIIE
jgi:hypothetical protein